MIGVLVALAMVAAKLRERAAAGCATASRTSRTCSSSAKNLAFVALIVGLSYMLATYKGLPNVLVIMVALILVYDFVTRRTTVGRRIYASAATRRRRACRA